MPTIISMSSHQPSSTGELPDSSWNIILFGPSENSHPLYTSLFQLGENGYISPCQLWNLYILSSGEKNPNYLYHFSLYITFCSVYSFII